MTEETPSRGPFAFLTRRRVLKLLGGTGVVVGTGVGALFGLRGCAPDVEGLSTLSEHGHRTLSMLADTVLPRGGAFPQGAADADMARTFDAFLADEPPENVRDLTRALHLIEFGAVLFDGHLRTFSHLSPAERLTYWQGWMYGDSLTRRQVAVAFRKFLTLVFFDRPEVWPAIGYPGPSFHGMPGARPPPPPPAPTPGIVDCSKVAPPKTLRTDVLIIGSGAGGGTAAWVLAEAGRQVTVLEEGPDRTGAQLTQRDAAMYDQLYMDRGGRMTTDLAITVLQGRALGGGTVINAADVVPMVDGVLRHWVSAHGLTDYTPAAIAPYTARALADLGARAIDPLEVNRANALLQLGAERLGLRGGLMRTNRQGCAGLGTCLIGCPLDAKLNTRRVAIPAALAAGASVYCRARVVRIEDAQAEIKRVHVRTLDAAGYHETGEFTIEARAVILAASAIGSAALLLRSGLGNDQVGRHLSLQPQLPILAFFDETVAPFRGIPQSYAITHFEEEDHTEHGLWGYRVEGVMGTPGVVSSLLPWAGAEAKTMMTRYPNLAAALLLTPDRPLGRVRVTDSGRVKVERALDADLVHRWRHAVRTAARAYFAAGAVRVVVPTAPPLVFDDAKGIDAVDRFAFAPATAPLLSAHQQGGVRMAPSPAGGAADPAGLIYGTRGIWCVDSGLYPTSSSSHTMTPILATSRMLSERIAG